MFVAVTALLALFAASSGVMFLSALRQPLNVADEGMSYWLAPGASMTTMVRDLSQILPYPRLTLWWGRISGIDSRLQSGEYPLSSKIDALEFLRRIDDGEVVQHRLTLPEGWTFNRALAALHNAGLRPALKGLDKTEIIEALGMRGYDSPEGLLFPDTYVFSRGQSDVDILRVAHRRMTETLSREWRSREPGLPYRDIYQALIMASIVEKETAVASERAMVAGVLVRRLHEGMRLATDPTVIYGLGEAFDGDLRREHLSDGGNPYNTYRIRGLPPTPIALPGLASIRAALHPAAGSSLYFVATGDGRHVFTDTLEAHRAAVRRYQLKKR